MPLAYNDKGDALYLDDASKTWKPAPVATNPKGEKLIFDGKTWTSPPAVPSRAAPAAKAGAPTPPGAPAPSSRKPGEGINIGGVDLGKGGILSRIGTAISAGPTATAEAYQNPETRAGAATAATLATGPIGAEFGDVAGEALGLGKWGMALARTAGMTLATAPLSEKPVAQAGWTAALGLVSEGLLFGGGQYAEEAERAEGAARITGEMTPAKIKALAAQRALLATAGKTPEEIDSYINGQDAAQQTKEAYHKVITNQKAEYGAGYDQIFDKPSKVPDITVGDSPVDTAPISRKIDELEREVDRRGMEPAESAATKRLLGNIKQRLGGGGVGDPVKFQLENALNYAPDDIATMSQRQLDNFKAQMIADGTLAKDGSLPGPQAGETTTVDQVHGFRTSLRGLRGARSTPTTRWISNQLEGTANEVMTKGMTEAGTTPEDFANFAKLDQKWGTISEMEHTFRKLDGVKYGHAAARALWDIGEGKQYETLNDFFKMAQNAAKVDPAIMPALKESFLTKVIGDARIEGGTDLNVQGLIMRKITDTFRVKTPDVMTGIFGADSPFADVRQFARVMGKSVDPNTTNTLKSTLGGVLAKPAKVAAYGGSGYFLFRLAYAMATGDSPWQDLSKHPAKFAVGMAEVMATGAVASIILTRGSALQQRAWADMMLHPDNAATVRNFAEAASPLVAEQVIKMAESKQAAPAPAP